MVMGGIDPSFRQSGTPTVISAPPTVIPASQPSIRQPNRHSGNLNRHSGESRNPTAWSVTTAVKPATIDSGLRRNDGWGVGMTVGGRRFRLAPE